MLPHARGDDDSDHDDTLTTLIPRVVGGVAQDIEFPDLESEFVWVYTKARPPASSKKQFYVRDRNRHQRK
jgi:hypothetical protein